MPSEVTSAAVNLRLALIGLAVPVQAEEETSANDIAQLIAGKAYEYRMPSGKTDW